MASTLSAFRHDTQANKAHIAHEQHYRLRFSDDDEEGDS